MKIHMIIAATTVMIVGLSGCVVVDEHPGRGPARIKYYDYDHHDKHGYHCPPGQHKKGRC